MSTAATFAAIVAGKQARYIRRFQEAGITHEAAAASLEDVRCKDSAAFEALVRRGVMIQAATGKYYLNQTAADSIESRRRAVMLIVFVVVIILFLVARWGR